MKGILFIVLFSAFLTVQISAQEKKVATASLELYHTIALQDSLLFSAYNHQNLEVMKNMFTTDLEWFQDNGGVLNYNTVINNFDRLLHQENKLTRNLVKGSMEVHPIKDYGAIETGSHQFTHFENGKWETGTFKFLMIWKNTPTGWKVSRVVSYDH